MARGVKSNGVAIGIAVTLLGVGLATIVLMRGIATVDSPWIPKCTIHRLTGLHCPGCGSTRAVHAIASGRIREAIAFNPLFVLALPLIVAGLVWQRNRERHGRRALPGLAWSIFVLLIVYTLARNLPSPDRGWLAPPSSVSEGGDPEPYPAGQSQMQDDLDAASR